MAGRGILGRNVIQQGSDELPSIAFGIQSRIYGGIFITKEAVMKRHSCKENNAERMAEWITNRGGLAIWKSINLSNPGASWTTPALSEDGKPYDKPNWQSANEPAKIITNPEDVDVITYKEVNRFHVAIRSKGMFSFCLTDASDRKVKKALDKAGEGSTYHFDYEYQDCIIKVPDKTITLKEWMDNANTKNIHSCGSYD